MFPKIEHDTLEGIADRRDRIDEIFQPNVRTLAGYAFRVLAFMISERQDLATVPTEYVPQDSISRRIFTKFYDLGVGIGSGTLQLEEERRKFQNSGYVGGHTGNLSNTEFDLFFDGIRQMNPPPQDSLQGQALNTSLESPS